MPSFDIVSEIDMTEVRNAVENASRELTTRWDFRNVLTNIELNEKTHLIKASSESEFQVQQLLDVLRDKLSKRGIEAGAMEILPEIIHSGKTYSVEVKLKQGIESLLAKTLVKLIKENKLKVQTQIQGDQLRVIGKSRDDLQSTMTLIKNNELAQPIQFTNFRD